MAGDQFCTSPWRLNFRSGYSFAVATIMEKLLLSVMGVSVCEEVSSEGADCDCNDQRDSAYDLSAWRDGLAMQLVV